MNVKRCLSRCILSLMVVVGIGCQTRTYAPRQLSGTIFFEDRTTLAFSDMTDLIFSLEDGAESIPQNVSDWPVAYDDSSVSRSIPLSWVKSIEVQDAETRGLYRCLFNPVVSIESVTGVIILSRYKTLEWVRVKVDSDPSGEHSDRFIYFADSGVYLQTLGHSRLNIRKIVFDGLSRN